MTFHYTAASLPYYIEKMLYSTVIRVLATAGLLAVAASCSLTAQPYHEIRVRNDFDKTIVRLTIGPALFADVAPGVTSEYREIPEGKHEFRGSLKDGRIIEGSWDFTGNGRHQWTAVLGASGAFSFYED